MRASPLPPRPPLTASLPALLRGAAIASLLATSAPHPATADTDRPPRIAGTHQTALTPPTAFTPSGFVLDGDSITNGYGATPTYPDHLAAITGKNTVNLGVSGRTLADMAATFESRGVADLHDKALTDTLVILGGINDILHDAATTPATLQRLLLAYCHKARAAGFRVIVVTLLPVDGLPPQREAIRTAHNAWIRETWPTFADALADAALAPPLSAPADRRYYSDGLHLTPKGLRALADVIQNAPPVP